MTELLIRAACKGADRTDPAQRSVLGKLAGLVGIICNLILFAGKLIVGITSGSVSITADAVNNLSDASSSVVALLGFRLSEKPADAEHPFGHARIEYLSGMGVAVLILFNGFELAKSSLEKILHPTPVEFSWVLVGVLAGSILAKLWMAVFNTKVGRTIDSATLQATAADSRNDVISTGAVLIASLLGAFLHWQLDGIMGLAVALFILYSGLGILKDTAAPLLGEAPTEELTATIARRLNNYDKVLGVHDLIVHDYGPGRRFASVHVEMDSTLDPLLAHDIIDNIERDFVTREKIELVIHYDPVVVGDPVVDATHAYVKEKLTAVSDRLRMHDFRMVSGVTHTNLIFDVVCPFDLEYDPETLKKKITEAVTADHPEYFLVMEIDMTYAPTV